MTCESTGPEKSQLRAQFREKRRAIPGELRQLHDQTINGQIEAFTSLKDASRVAGYLAFDGEPDISAALARINSANAQVCLPVITASVNEAALIFRRWLPHGASSLRKNTLGIEEPVIGPEVAAADLDIIFMPLVAWDESGGRLGMGAGYYDRALAGVANDKTPLRIGVAYEIQCAAELPMTEHDVRLHGMITEEGLQIFNE